MRSTQALVVSLLFAGATAQSQYRPGGGSSGAGGFGGSSGGSFGGGAGGFGDYDDAGAGGAGGDLEENIPGVPGDDYPIYAEVPDTSFLCDGQAEGGYYADVEAECQVFHICGSDGNGGLTKYSFLCPNGTLFNQQYFVCDWWFNVDCSLAEQFYALNDQIAAERDANSPAGAAGGYQSGSGVTAGRSGGGAGGNQQYQGGRSGGSSGGRRGGNTASASSPRGSYSSPDNFGSSGFGGDSGFGGSSADSGYGAPAGGSLSGYGGRRRNARDLDLSDADRENLAEVLSEEYDY